MRQNEVRAIKGGPNYANSSQSSGMSYKYAYWYYSENNWRYTIYFQDERVTRIEKRWSDY